MLQVVSFVHGGRVGRAVAELAIEGFLVGDWVPGRLVGGGRREELGVIVGEDKGFGVACGLMDRSGASLSL